MWPNLRNEMMPSPFHYQNPPITDTESENYLYTMCSFAIKDVHYMFIYYKSCTLYVHLPSKDYNMCSFTIKTVQCVFIYLSKLYIMCSLLIKTVKITFRLPVLLSGKLQTTPVSKLRNNRWNVQTSYTNNTQHSKVLTTNMRSPSLFLSHTHTGTKTHKSTANTPYKRKHRQRTHITQWRQTHSPHIKQAHIKHVKFIQHQRRELTLQAQSAGDYLPLII